MTVPTDQRVMPAPGGPVAPRIDWRTERERIDLAAVVTGLLGPAPGRRGARGQRLWWPCPFHQDRNPSFCVTPGHPWWRCYGCGASGDAANLLMRLETLSFPEAIARLTGGSVPPKSGKAPGRPGVAPAPPAGPSGLPEAAALALVESAAARLWSPEGSTALAYLIDSRRLTPATIRAARLGWTPRADGVPWKPPGWVITWFQGDRLAKVNIRVPDAWRARFPKGEGPPKYLSAFSDPARLVCYPSPAMIRAGRPLIIVEGEFDALCLGDALGGMAAVVTLGSASARPGPAALGPMLAAAPWFIATDADPAGDKSADGWTARARRVRPPGSFKDWTECAQTGVNLARWWQERLAGIEYPVLYTWDDLRTWRWGPAVGDSAPGIVSRGGADRDTLRAVLAADH